MAQVKRFVCPKCGSEDISELCLYVVTIPVTKWTDSGEPVDYGLAEVDWNGGYPYATLFDQRPAPELTFECTDCSAQFERPNLAVGSRCPHD